MEDTQNYSTIVNMLIGINQTLSQMQNSMILRDEFTNSMSQMRDEFANSMAQMRNEFTNSMSQMREKTDMSISNLREELCESITQMRKEFNSRFDLLEKKVDKNSNNIMKLQKEVIDLRDDFYTVYDLEIDTRKHLKLN